MSEIDKGNSPLTPKDLDDFCGGCELARRIKNIFCKVGVEYQTAAIDRGWCHYAKIEGVEGRKTEKGFEPHQNIEKTSK